MFDPAPEAPFAVTSFIIQLTAPGDRSEEENAICDEGRVPLAVFAEGAGEAFLIKTTLAHLDEALSDAALRRQGPREARLAFREALFNALAGDVEAGFAEQASLRRFPNDALRLFAEAAYQAGHRGAETIPACAVRFRRGAYAQPDFDAAAAPALNL
jgi:hypothetical protein